MGRKVEATSTSCEFTTAATEALAHYVKMRSCTGCLNVFSPSLVRLYVRDNATKLEAIPGP